MSKVGAKEVAGAQAIACPRCKSVFLFTRNSAPHIDECGLETYRLMCNDCGTPIDGVIDPADDTLLISEPAAMV